MVALILCCSKIILTVRTELKFKYKKLEMNTFQSKWFQRGVPHPGYIVDPDAIYNDANGVTSEG